MLSNRFLATLEALPSIGYTLSSSDPKTRSTPANTIKEYYNCFTESLCFQFTVLVIIVAFILNVIGWALVLILFMAGAANRTISDKDTRDIWIEIASQVLNGMFFIPIVVLLPWRLYRLYQLHSKQHRPRLRKRYSVNIIWIGIFLWGYIINTIFVIAIAVCLWSINRHIRPTWVMGILVGFAIFSGVTSAIIELILERREKRR